MSTMKKMFLLAALGLLSTGAFAQDEGFALGVKYAFDIDVDDVDDGDGYGVNLGYGFGNGWSAELDLISGDLDDTGFDVDVMGLYGVYRSSGAGYFLGKIGYADGEVDAGVFGTADDTGLSYGIGGGYRFNDSFALEGEYTMYDFDDAESTIIAFTARFLF